MGHRCPVCGYHPLLHPPENQYICPCCGTEFGYEDYAETYEGRVERQSELRQRWFDRNMPWFSRATPPPPGWDPLQQLMRLSEIKTEADFAQNTVQPFVNPMFWQPALMSLAE